jgi:hypothetical protein
MIDLSFFDLSRIRYRMMLGRFPIAKNKKRIDIFARVTRAKLSKKQSLQG